MSLTNFTEISFDGEDYNFTLTSPYERKILDKLIDCQARKKPYLIENTLEYKTLNYFIDIGVFKFLKHLANL